MEITRQIKPIIAAPNDASVQARPAPAAVRQAPVRAAKAESLPLEQLQADLEALPEVDLDKVQQIKQALARGEISLDVGVLSRSILAYHSGSDA